MSGLHDLLAKEKQALHVENLLMDNNFVERLADKVVGKLGFVPGTLGGGGASKPAAAGQPIAPKAEEARGSGMPQRDDQVPRKRPAASGTPPRSAKRVCAEPPAGSPPAKAAKTAGAPVVAKAVRPGAWKRYWVAKPGERWKDYTSAAQMHAKTGISRGKDIFGLTEGGPPKYLQHLNLLVARGKRMPRLVPKGIVRD